MTPTEKLAVAVQGMWGKNTAWCHHLGAVLLVAENECAASPAQDAVKDQVKKMQSLCRKLCVSYDNLRALVARLEIEQGVEKPRFWPGDINKSDKPVRCQLNGGK